MRKVSSNPMIDGLRNNGARITAQRIAICEWLEACLTHPTAADVYDALHERYPTMSLATVYNTLSTLAALDLIHEIGQAEDGSIRYDPHIDPHVNLVCSRCQRIIDLEMDLSLIQQAAIAAGFTPDHTTAVVHGLCADCHAELKQDQRLQETE